MAKSKREYGNESISMLEGADRVRKRPGVIFGSDGLEGCEHAVCEILSNAIDEAREGYGKEIILTRFRDGRIQVEDFGRGCPVDWNEKVGKYNWELVFCELYAGGKYDNAAGDNYEYSLGLNGLGACATQYASRFMDVVVRRDGKRYDLHFEKGSLVGEMKVSPADRKKTGTTITWLPDLEVFTQTDIPTDYFTDILHRQAVVNAGVVFRFRNQGERGFEETLFTYENGIADYVAELAGQAPHTPIQFWTGERTGRDRPDKPDYKVKLSCAFCFCPAHHIIEHYHNSSWLEHGGAPEKAMRSAFLSAMDGWLKQNNKYNKNEAKITWPDVQETLIFVSNNFSTQTSYENQTKKAVNNRFIQEGMTEFLREKLQIFLLENPQAVEEAARQKNIRNGTITGFTTGGVAALTTLEFEPGLVGHDLKAALDVFSPYRDEKGRVIHYQHHDTWHDDNGSSHIKALLLSPFITVPIVAGRMTLGPWQNLTLVECDTRDRVRDIVFQVMGE